MYAVLDTLIAKYGSQYFISERVCRVIRLGMQFFGESAIGLAPTLLRRCASSFQATGYSSYLWLQGKVVSYFGSSSDLALQAVIRETFELSSAQVFAVLKVQQPADIPDGQCSSSPLDVRSVDMSILQ